MAASHGFVTLPDQSGRPVPGTTTHMAALAAAAAAPTFKGSLRFVAGTRNGARLVRFRAPEARCNEALAGLVWQGDLDWFGQGWLNVTVNDLGYSGFGGPKNDSVAIPVTVHPVVDPPVLRPPEGVISVYEDHKVSFTRCYRHTSKIPSHLPSSSQLLTPPLPPLARSPCRRRRAAALQVHVPIELYDADADAAEHHREVLNLTQSALAADPTLGKWFEMLASGVGPAAVADAMANEGLDPSVGTDGTPAGDSRGTYGGRAPILDEAALEVSPTRTFPGLACSERRVLAAPPVVATRSQFTLLL